MVKAFATQPNDPSVIPTTHKVREDSSGKMPSDLHTVPHMPAPDLCATYTHHTKEINKQKKLKINNGDSD